MLTEVFSVLKSFIDPVFIIFVLLLISLIVWLLSVKKKDGVLILFFTLTLFYGLSIQPVSNYLSYQLEKKYIGTRHLEEGQAPDIVVALGGGFHDIQVLEASFPGDSTVVRLAHAVRMFKRYQAKYLVCSGTGLSKMSQAEQMAQDFGIPKERIRIEAKSKNTSEHARELNKMFADKGIRIGLVTSAYHMQRSEREFKKFFSAVIPLPSNYLYASPAGPAFVRYVPQSRWLFHNTLVFREYAGKIWYRMKDY